MKYFNARILRKRFFEKVVPARMDKLFHRCTCILNEVPKEQGSLLRPHGLKDSVRKPFVSLHFRQIDETLLETDQFVSVLQVYIKT